MGCASSRPVDPKPTHPQDSHSTSGKHTQVAMLSYNTHYTFQNMPLPPPPAAHGRIHTTRTQNSRMPPTPHHQYSQHRKHLQPQRTHAGCHAGPHGRPDVRYIPVPNSSISPPCSFNKMPRRHPSQMIRSESGWPSA